MHFIGEEPKNKEFKEKLILYKNNYIIKAYEGKFQINGNPELIKLAYQTGLSNKNSSRLSECLK